MRMLLLLTHFVSSIKRCNSTVLFKENSGGCYVSRVFKSGGDVERSVVQDSVEVGDQLTAINGRSAMRKSVSDVCRIMSASLDPKKIAITLLRYTGPIGPHQFGSNLGASFESAHSSIGETMAVTAKSTIETDDSAFNDHAFQAPSGDPFGFGRKSSVEPPVVQQQQQYEQTQQTLFEPPKQQPQQQTFAPPQQLQQAQQQYQQPRPQRPQVKQADYARERVAAEDLPSAPVAKPSSKEPKKKKGLLSIFKKKKK